MLKTLPIRNLDDIGCIKNKYRGTESVCAKFKTRIGVIND